MNEMTEPYGDLKSVRRTQRNVDLLLKYGYRFDELEAQLKSLRASQRNPHDQDQSI